MKQIYTEQEIKDWFANMIKKYQNCPMSQHLQSVYDEMFDPFWERNNLKTLFQGKTKKIIKE